MRSRTSTTSVEATLKVETSTISPSTRKSATCWSLSAVNSSRLSWRQSVTMKSGSRMRVAASAIRGASLGSATVNSSRSMAASAPISFSTCARSSSTQLRSNSAKPVAKVAVTRRLM